METILWTVDTIDWKNPSVSVMINRVMGNIHPGATILMHPTESVAQGLENLIDEMKHEKYKIGTIEDLLSTRSEEQTSELQSRGHIVCRILLEKKRK